MLGIQVSIGALNDLVDEPNDARQKPRKPIPSGMVGRRAARVVVVLGGGAASPSPPCRAGRRRLPPSVASVLGTRTTCGCRGPLCPGCRCRWPCRCSRSMRGSAQRATIPAGLVTLVPIGVLGVGDWPSRTASSMSNATPDRAAARWRSRSGAAGRGWPRRWRSAIAALLAVFLAPGVAVVGPGPARRDARRTSSRRCRPRHGAHRARIRLPCGGRPGVRERGWELEAVGVAGTRSRRGSRPSPRPWSGGPAAG